MSAQVLANHCNRVVLDLGGPGQLIKREDAFPALSGSPGVSPLPNKTTLAGPSPTCLLEDSSLLALGDASPTRTVLPIAAVGTQHPGQQQEVARPARRAKGTRINEFIKASFQALESNNVAQHEATKRRHAEQQGVRESKAFVHDPSEHIDTTSQPMAAAFQWPSPLGYADVASDSDESDGESGRRQATDKMPGCFSCNFARAGCKVCISTPLLIRPRVRCKPEEARPQHVPEAPTFYPTEQEFADPIAYISSVRDQAAPFGMCRIVPPPSWEPPFMLSQQLVQQPNINNQDQSEQGVQGSGHVSGVCFRAHKQFTSHLCMRAPSTFNAQPGSATAQVEQDPSARTAMQEQSDATLFHNHFQIPQPQPSDASHSTPAASFMMTAVNCQSEMAAEQNNATQSATGLSQNASGVSHDNTHWMPPMVPMSREESQTAKKGIVGSEMQNVEDTALHLKPALSAEQTNHNHMDLPLPHFTLFPVQPSIDQPHASVHPTTTDIQDPHSSMHPGLPFVALPSSPTQHGGDDERLLLQGHGMFEPLVSDWEMEMAAQQGLNLQHPGQCPTPIPPDSIPGHEVEQGHRVHRRRHRKHRTGGVKHEDFNDLLSDVAESGFSSDIDSIGSEFVDGSLTLQDSLLWEEKPNVAETGNGFLANGSDQSDATLEARPVAGVSDTTVETLTSKINVADVKHTSMGTNLGNLSPAESPSAREVGFSHSFSDQDHTIQSFAAYAGWAKAMHFRLFQKRLPTSMQADDKAMTQSQADGKSADTVALQDMPLLPGPSVEQIEGEFWRLVEAPEPGRVVETLYGSGLDSSRFGSGFPLPEWRQTTATDVHQDSYDSDTHEPTSQQDYSHHSWNIHNISRCASSMLKYARCQELVPGMMAPWLHVGSCLSAFCWHIEEHSLYSINYLHHGEPKVWYGVPAHASLSFEMAMRDALPHLFAEDPLLLHRLVTILSPTELMARGIPVHRLVQETGSFVVTFPGAYHAGFNTGFNIAEAVNFAPPDWLPFGTDVVRKYRAQGKAPSISHDLLLVTLVTAAPLVAAKAGLAPKPCLPVLDLGGVSCSRATTPTPRLEFLSPVPLMLPVTMKIEDEKPPEVPTRGKRRAAMAAAAVISAVSNDEADVQHTPAWLDTHGSQLSSPTPATTPITTNALPIAMSTASPALPPFLPLSAMALNTDSPITAPSPSLCIYAAPMAPSWLNRWNDSVSLSNIPIEAVMLAIGELAVRIDDEHQRVSAAKQYGITQEQRMVDGDEMCVDESGMHTNTIDKTCISCKCDLYLSAVVSLDRPGVCTCPEHASALGLPANRCILLYRHPIQELESKLRDALLLFPAAQAHIDAARLRVASPEVAVVHRLGPIVVLEGMDTKFLPGDELMPGVTVVDPFQGHMEVSVYAVPATIPMPEIEQQPQQEPQQLQQPLPAGIPVVAPPPPLPLSLPIIPPFPAVFDAFPSQPDVSFPGLLAINRGGSKKRGQRKKGVNPWTLALAHIPTPPDLEVISGNESEQWQNNQMKGAEPVISNVPAASLEPEKNTADEAAYGAGKRRRQPSAKVRLEQAEMDIEPAMPTSAAVFGKPAKRGAKPALVGASLPLPAIPTVSLDTSIPLLGLDISSLPDLAAAQLPPPPLPPAPDTTITLPSELTISETLLAAYNAQLPLPPQPPPLQASLVMTTPASAAPNVPAVLAGTALSMSEVGRPQRKRKPPTHMLTDEFVADIPSWPSAQGTNANDSSNVTSSAVVIAPPPPLLESHTSLMGRPKRRSGGDHPQGCNTVPLVAPTGLPNLPAVWPATTASSGPVLVAPQSAVRRPATIRLHQNASSAGASSTTPASSLPALPAACHKSGTAPLLPAIPPLQSQQKLVKVGSGEQQQGCSRPSTPAVPPLLPVSSSSNAQSSSQGHSDTAGCQSKPEPQDQSDILGSKAKSKPQETAMADVMSCKPDNNDSDSPRLPETATAQGGSPAAKAASTVQGPINCEDASSRAERGRQEEQVKTVTAVIDIALPDINLASIPALNPDTLNSLVLPLADGLGVLSPQEVQGLWATVNGSLAGSLPNADLSSMLALQDIHEEEHQQLDLEETDRMVVDTTDVLAFFA